MLQIKNEDDEREVLRILNEDNLTTFCWRENDECATIHIDGAISFEAMRQIVEYLEHSNMTDYYNRVL